MPAQAGDEGITENSCFYEAITITIQADHISTCILDCYACQQREVFIIDPFPSKIFLHPDDMELPHPVDLF